MCRVLAYLGPPLNVEHVLFTTDSSLVRQAYSPRMMASFLNLAGFGMVAWDPKSRMPEAPFVYRVTTFPVFDRNLENLARKIAPRCFLAHVRGVPNSPEEVVSQQNVHPFLYSGAHVALAHNGFLRDFGRMRHGLLEFIRPELAQRIEGTTDSEWLYVLLLSQLDDPCGVPGPDELVAAVARTLSIVRRVRERHDIRVSSPVNLFVSTGQCVIVTRFSFDYGWYPPEDRAFLELDLAYVSLWYTLGDEYLERGGEWMMTPAGDRPRSLILASEPLTRDVSTWLEVPEYSMLTAWITDDGLRFQALDLDV
jgi:glutamine amidotransferase